MFILIGGDSIGGADKRFLNVYNYLKTNDKVNYYYFLLNNLKYNKYYKEGLIEENNDIISFGRAEKKKRSENDLSNGKIINRTTDVSIIKKIKSLILNWYKLFVSTWAIKKYLKLYDIDLVHTLWLGTIYFAPLHTLIKKPFHIFTYMDVSFSNVSKNIIKIPVSYNLALRTANHIDFLGNSYCKGLEKRGFKFNKDRISISPCSFIDYSKCHVQDKENLVVFAARLIEHKNPILFLQACKSVCDKRNDIRFEISGEGYLKNEVQRFIVNNDLSRFITLKYYSDIHQLFSKSKIFVSVQNEDNYPSQSILEAMASENVVIATDVGETYKLVTDEIGYRVNFNANEIADKIIYLIDNPAELITKAKLASKFIKENHTVEHFSKYLMETYDKFK